MAKAVKKKEEEAPINIKSAVTQAVTGKFDRASLEKFKKSHNLSSNAGFKPQEWLKVSDAFSEAVGIPGIPIGHITVIRGHSDSGKSTLLIEAAIASQKQGRLPVFIITEQKFDFNHCISMGLDAEIVVDKETGELTYEGAFIYVDLDSITTVEDIAKFILNLLDEQAKGRLNYPLDFYLDSMGTMPCDQSLASKTFNNEWTAGSISRNFGGIVDQRITLSRKLNKPFTNSLVVVNKVWLEKGTMFSPPILRNKGGLTLYSDASLVVLFGGLTSSQVVKIKAVKDKKEVEFGKRVKCAIEKNHLNGITTTTKVVATPHGFIKDTPASIEKYKRDHKDEWLSVLGDGEFEIVEESETTKEVDDIPEED